MTVRSLWNNLRQRLKRRVSTSESKCEKAPAPPQGSTVAADQRPGSSDQPGLNAPVPSLGQTPLSSALIPVVIGLDFGTFSTKMVARRRNERTGLVLCLDEPCAGYPCFTLPSLVRITHDKVFFGRCAAQADGGQLFRSLKVSLLTESCPTSDHALRADHLVALYLAWVMGRLSKWLAGEYGVNRTNVFVNAAAPMDHYEDSTLRKRYLRIVNAAWNAVLGPSPIIVEQGTPLGSLRPWLEEHIDPRTKIEPIETRRFDVLPETVAPIVSLSRHPRMRAGMHMIVDMGAGTTEFSVNHAPDPSGNQKILCYYDQSILLGAEQFENPSPGESEDSLTNKLLKELCRTWGRGYRKDADNLAARNRWKELTVLLAGGGTSRSHLCHKIELHQNAVMYAFQGVGCRYSVKTHVPTDLDFGVAESERKANGFLLSVAHGLSYPRRTWPEFVEPHHVKPMKGTHQAPRPDLPWFEVG